MKDKTKFGNSEVDILKQLQQSEQVVKLIEEHHDDYQTILITEFLSGHSTDHVLEVWTKYYNMILGGNLFERLSDPDYHLTEDKCKLFVRQIMSGVAFIHQQNIVHLNVTPYNIIFSNKVHTMNDLVCLLY